jgi:Cu/Ag efflux protein CusF
MPAMTMPFRVKNTNELAGPWGRDFVPDAGDGG